MVFFDFFVFSNLIIFFFSCYFWTGLGPHSPLPLSSSAVQKLHEARIFSCPLVSSQPVSSWAITKYLLAGWEWNTRAGGQRKPRQMSGSSVRAINNHSNYHHLLTAAFLNWYKRAKTNKDLHWLWGLWSSDIFRPGSHFSPALLISSHFPEDEEPGRCLAQHRDHGPGTNPQRPTRRPPPAYPSEVMMVFQVVNESCQTKSHFKSTLCKKPVLQHISFINYAMD